MNWQYHALIPVVVSTGGLCVSSRLLLNARIDVFPVRNDSMCGYDEPSLSVLLVAWLPSLNNILLSSVQCPYHCDGWEDATQNGHRLTEPKTVVLHDLQVALPGKKQVKWDSLSSRRSRPALGPNQNSIQWGLRFSAKGKMIGAWSCHSPTKVKNEYLYTPLMPSWHGRGHCYFLLIGEQNFIPSDQHISGKNLQGFIALFCR